jgi:Kef-type K+ transport system membrane component KefB/Trk K+ transport system NAD-binding subunit
MVLNSFVEISLIVLIALVISIIMRALKQPLIVGYIIAGIAVSPYFFNLASSSTNIEIFAKLGVALLLFMVGLNLNPKVIKEVGKVALITGIGQIILTFTLGFLIATALGFEKVTAAYISIAIAFSSTIIIMKILTDKNETETLYGKIAIGFLIVQDLVAIIILMAISSLTSKDSGSLTYTIAESLLIGSGLIITLFILALYVLPSITKFVAKSQELLLLFSISWCLAIASLFYYLNFSIEIGALLAGISLSMSPYKIEISSRMKPLRDFFILLFFIVIGSNMEFSNISEQIVPIILFSFFILIGNPIIVMSLMGMIGYTKRNSFLSGLTVSQISEFSFILIALGVSAGHISVETLTLITMVGLITMGGSTYAMAYSNKLYSLLSNKLKVFEKKGQKIDESRFHRDNSYEVILFGYNRIGFDVIKSFKKLNKKFLVVDYNPDTIQKLIKSGIECRYGDASDTELLNELDFTRTKMIVSTIPDSDINILLTKHIKSFNRKAIVIAISYQIEEAMKLYKEGASYIIMPHFLGGTHTSNLIRQHGLNPEKFLKEKFEHIKSLKKRKKSGHEHPRTLRNDEN